MYLSWPGQQEDLIPRRMPAATGTVGGWCPLPGVPAPGRNGAPVRKGAPSEHSPAPARRKPGDTGRVSESLAKCRVCPHRPVMALTDTCLRSLSVDVGHA
jgi:hypothetical protein